MTHRPDEQAKHDADEQAMPESADVNVDEPELDPATPEEDNEGDYRPPGILAGVGRMILETGPVALPLRGLGRAFQAFLEYCDYRLVWTGALLSNMGMWIQTVALQWLIKELSPKDTSALWLGRAVFFQQIPTMLLLPFGGVLADRIDRRWIMISGNIFLAIVALVMSQIQNAEATRMWHLMAVASMLGMWQAALIPSNQSLLPTLVSKANLPNAVALNAMQFNLSRAIGPAIGGVTLAAFGAAWSFGINAFSYVFVIIALLLICPPPLPTRKHESVIAAMRGGAGYITRRPDLKLMIALVFFLAFFSSPLHHMLPAIVEQMFDDKPSQFTKLLSCFGIGAVLGAGMLAARSHKQASPWRCLITLSMLGLLQFLLGFQTSFPIAMAILFFSGMAFTGSTNRMFAATLGSIPNRVRGRVASFQVMSMMLGFPLGGITAGWLATHWSIQFVLMTFGLSLVTILAIAAMYIRVKQLEFIDDHDGH